VENCLYFLTLPRCVGHQTCQNWSKPVPITGLTYDYGLWTRDLTSDLNWLRWLASSVRLVMYGT